VNSLASTTALKEDFKERRKDDAVVPRVNKKDTPMKLTTIALAAAFALTSTIALAQTGHRSGVKARHNTVGTMQGRPMNHGNPNGTADGPTTLSGTGSSQFGGSSPGTSGKN
jgi:hypothetical protein